MDTDEGGGWGGGGPIGHIVDGVGAAVNCYVLTQVKQSVIDVVFG